MSTVTSLGYIGGTAATAIEAASVTIPSGAGSGKVLTSDANGNATWASIGAPGFAVAWNGDTTSLTVIPAADDYTISVGPTFRADLAVGGANTLTWDASAGLLGMNGGNLLVNTRVISPMDTSSTNGGTISAGGVFDAAITRITTAAAETRILADCTVPGTIKTLIMTVRVGNCVVTPSSGPAMTFTAVGQSVTLMWTGLIWNVVGMSPGGTLPTVA
jgi:hypothetical protein